MLFIVHFLLCCFSEKEVASIRYGLVGLKWRKSIQVMVFVVLQLWSYITFTFIPLKKVNCSFNWVWSMKLPSLCVGFHSDSVKDSTDSQLSLCWPLWPHTLSEFFLLPFSKPGQVKVRGRSCRQEFLDFCVLLCHRWRWQPTISALARWRGGGGGVWGSSGSC